MDYLTRFAEFLTATCYEDLPPAVVAHARLVFLDTVGVILAGNQEPECRALLQNVRTLQTGATASVLTDGLPRLEPSWAAFLNGTAGVFLELDEGHRPTGHPAIHVVPAPLALAEQLGSSGRDLLAAIVLAYEVPVRISAAWHMRPGVHPHGNMGSPGAAAACGRLLGFDAAQQRQALNVAASLPLASAWLPCVEGATVRNAYTGVSAFVGIAAAQLVRSGFTGLHNAWPSTFGNLLGTGFDEQGLTDNLGTVYEITRDYFKFHACCAYNHAPLDAIQEALAGRRFPADAIERIEVATLPHYLKLSNPHPHNQLAAKFAIPYAVAVAVVRGSSFVDSFQPTALAREDIHALAERVQLVGDASMLADWPDQARARATIHLRDGRTLHGECLNPRGHHANPVSADEVRAKFVRLTEPIFGERAVEVARVVERLDSYGDVREMTEAMRRYSKRENTGALTSGKSGQASGSSRPSGGPAT